MNHPDCDLSEYEVAREVYFESLTIGYPFMRVAYDDETAPGWLFAATIDVDKGQPVLQSVRKTWVVAVHRRAVELLREINSDPELEPYGEIVEAYLDAIDEIDHEDREDERCSAS